MSLRSIVAAVSGTVGGKAEQAYGTACQQPDVAWEIVSTKN